VALPSTDPSKNGPVKLALIVSSAAPVLLLLTEVAELCKDLVDAGVLAAVGAVLIVPLWVCFPFLVALAAALVLHGLLALGRAFRRELAAFARADVPVRTPPKETGKPGA
jgi:hypothetical protein